MIDGREPLTLREAARLTFISAPLTVGFAYLLELIEGYDKVGWVWWPALLGFVFSVGVTVAGLASLLRSFIGLTIKRMGGTVEGLSDWVGKLVAYIIVVALVIWVATVFIDALDKISRRELAAFVIGGLVVYIALSRRK